MKLSVIVPVYDVEDYLACCIDSLLAQTLKDMEILLVDDGSKDRSGTIADSYAAAYPDRIRCLHLENGGQGRARNAALPLARGEYLGFVDSDDWVLPDMYEKLCSEAEESGASIVACDFLERYDDGREKQIPAAFQRHPLSFAGSCCNKVFRSALVGDLRFPEGTWYEDLYYSAMALIRSEKTEWIHEALYIYRRGQPSTMHNNNAAKNLDILTVMNALESELESRGRREDFEFLMLNHVLLDTISRLAIQRDPERKDVIRHVRAWVHVKLPKLLRSRSYQAENRRRRTVMFLNYHGLEKAAQGILRLKKTLAPGDS